MRAPHALLPAEMDHVEAWVRKVTGARRLWLEAAPNGRALNHNHAQLVGMAESGPRPHTDSRALCRYAAVIYLSREPAPEGGQRYHCQAGDFVLFNPDEGHDGSR
jgi:hypothetical protein